MYTSDTVCTTYARCASLLGWTSELDKKKKKHSTFLELFTRMKSVRVLPIRHIVVINRNEQKQTKIQRNHAKKSYAITGRTVFKTQLFFSLSTT